MSRRTALQDYRTSTVPQVRVDAVVWEAVLAEIDLLRELVADLYDPNDCTPDQVCDEHNSWDARAEGRACPHRRARALLRKWRA